MIEVVADCDVWQLNVAASLATLTNMSEFLRKKQRKKEDDSVLLLYCKCK